MVYGERSSSTLSDGGSGGGGGLCKDVCTLDPAVLTSDELWGDSVLVGAIWDGAAREEGAHDGEMAVGGCKVERGRAGCADYGAGCVAIAVGVAAGESGDG